MLTCQPDCPLPWDIRCFICPPPWPEAKEKSFAEQMNFLGLWPGGWAFNFWHQFWFSTVPPQGGSFVAPPFGAITRFWLQIQFSIVLPQGGSFGAPPFGAIPHFWLQIQFSILLPQGAHSLGHRRGQLLTSFFKHRQNIEVDVFFRTSPKNRIVKNWETLHR